MLYPYCPWIVWQLRSHQNQRGSSYNLLLSFSFIFFSFSYFLFLISFSRNVGNLSLHGLFAKAMFNELKERMGPALSILTASTERDVLDPTLKLCCTSQVS